LKSSDLKLVQDSSALTEDLLIKKGNNPYNAYGDDDKRDSTLITKDDGNANS